MRTAQRIAVESVRNLVARVSQLVSSETFPERAFWVLLPVLPRLATVLSLPLEMASVPWWSSFVLTLSGVVSPRLKLYQVVVRKPVASLSLLDNCDVR